ncbi:carcinoembryonic antigen-related cell adhesion molecule 5-like [Sus scrofa]|uniref:carcinoembryonic antigen-related cell adhesion molecule 5-like n=1 Tax=Sus scrofa TaxID=9823 RepID=UPI000A2B90D9|nr:carcinoembryonic antigen-related cell adhesion molecule 5-like [Sus scrofa]
MAQQILTFHVISGGLTLGPAHTGQETVKPDGSHRRAQPRRHGPLHPTEDFDGHEPPDVECLPACVREAGSTHHHSLHLGSPGAAGLRDLELPVPKQEPVVGSGQLELSLDQQRLTIHQVTRNDSGPYQCEVKNPAITSLSEPLLLDVILLMDNQWEPGPSGQQLFLSAIHLGTAGVYTCEATNPASGSHSAINTLIVIPEYMPQPSILADNIAPMEDMDSVTLTHWGPRGAVPRPQVPHPPNITRNDTGLYQCEASNSATSSLSNPLPVNMNYGPGVPVINPMDSTFVAGSNLTLSCFASSNPPAAYTWRVDGSPGPAGQLLSILDVSLNSSGLYSCHAANADTGLQSMAQLVVHIKDQGSCVFSPEKIQTIQHGVMIQKAGYYLAIHHLTSYPVKEEKTHKLHVQRRSNWDVNSETAGCHGTHGSLEI